MSQSLLFFQLSVQVIKHHSDTFTKEEGVHFFNEQSKKYHEKLQAAEKRFKEFQKKGDIVDLEKQNASNIELLADLKRDLEYIGISCDQAESMIGLLQIHLYVQLIPLS